MLKQIPSYPAPLRLGIFILLLLLIWLPLALPIRLLLANDLNLATILTMGILFIEFICFLPWWQKTIYDRPHIFKHYGLFISRQNAIDFINGLSIGFCCCLALFILEGICGWLQWQKPDIWLFKIIIEGLISACLIALAEELVFRGWLLDELEKDYYFPLALWVNAIIFACLHFLKPLEEILRTFVTFPALVLLALILVWAKKSCRNRLGICIGLHGGLVWSYYILNVGKLIKYSEVVPPWITGIDGNPIAGLMGLLFLGVLAFWMKNKALKIQ